MSFHDDPGYGSDSCCSVEALVQLLTPDGSLTTHPDFSPEMSPEQAADGLRWMLLARRFDKEATALQRKGQLGLWPPLQGQEAAQVGSTMATQGLDWIFPGYREHAVALMRGVEPLTLLKTFRGSTMVDWVPADHNLHLYSFVIGTQTLHATGYAMGMMRDGIVGSSGENGAVLVHLGDGATSQGDVSESLVFSASYHAPVVFFVQNNQWAISEPIEVQSRIPLYKRAAGFGIPSLRVDGNDLLAVHSVTQWALDRARRGEGPTLIEAFTYRMGAHTTSDDPTKYRRREEEEHWRTKDPIDRLSRFLRNEGVISDAWLQAVEDEAAELADMVRQGCPLLESPPLREYWADVYHRMPRELQEQLADHDRYESAFEEVRND